MTATHCQTLQRTPAGRLVKAKRPIIVLIGALAILAGCTHATKTSPAAAGSTRYEERFDPWRASNRALKPASRGDRNAQIAFFLSAYVRMSQPYMGGEDLEQMRANVGHLVATLGDDSFSRALEQQRPEVRSAVRSFLDTKSVKRDYPKTYRLLDAAPKIDWPALKVYRNAT